MVPIKNPLAISVKRTRKEGRTCLLCPVFVAEAGRNDVQKVLTASRKMRYAHAVKRDSPAGGGSDDERFLMQRISRYLFRHILIAFLFASVGVTCVVLFTQSFRLLSFVVDNSGTTLIFFQLLGLIVPTFLPLVVPISVGVGVLFIYHKFAVDSEIVVMRAAGISPLRLALPAVVLGLLATAFCYLLTVWATPAANRALVALQYEVRDSYSVFLAKPGAFNDISDGLTFYIRSRGKDGGLNDLLIHDIRNPERPVTIMADSGRFNNANGVAQFEVFKGKRQELDRSTGRLSQLNFDRYVVDLQLLRNGITNRVPDPREETMAELIHPTAKLIKGTPQHLVAEIHQRLTSPLLALDFALIALTAILAGQFNRRGMAHRILIAAAVIVAIQAATVSLGSLISKQILFVPVLYSVVIAPLPVCLMILMLPAWRRARPSPAPASPP